MVPVIILIVAVVVIAAVVRRMRSQARRAFAGSVRSFIEQTSSTTGGDAPMVRRTRMSGYDVDVIRIADDDARVTWNPLHAGEFDERIAMRFAQYPDGHRLVELPGSYGGDEFGAKLLPELAKVLRAVQHGTVVQVDAHGGTTTLHLFAATEDDLATTITETMRPGRALHRLVAFETRKLQRQIAETDEAPAETEVDVVDGDVSDDAAPAPAERAPQTSPAGGE